MKWLCDGITKLRFYLFARVVVRCGSVSMTIPAGAANQRNVQALVAMAYATDVIHPTRNINHSHSGIPDSIRLDTGHSDMSN